MLERLRELQMQDVSDMQAIQTLVNAGIDPDEAAGAIIGGTFHLSTKTRDALHARG